MTAVGRYRTRDHTEGQAIDEQLLELIVAGESQSAAAKLLGITVSSAAVRLHRLRRDCGASTNAQLAYQVGYREGVRDVLARVRRHHDPAGAGS